MSISAPWAAVARSWMDSSSDTIVRFKTLHMLHLLIPHLDDSELNKPFITSVVTALNAGLTELEAEQRVQLDVQAQMGRYYDEATAAAPGVASAGKSAPVGRKPPALALAEEALAVLHDVAKRKAASGQLASPDGIGASIVWVVAGLCGTIYPTLLAECWPMLSLLLGDGLLRESLIGSSASAAPPRSCRAHDATPIVAACSSYCSTACMPSAGGALPRPPQAQTRRLSVSPLQCIGIIYYPRPWRGRLSRRYAMHATYKPPQSCRRWARARYLLETQSARDPAPRPHRSSRR